MPRSIERARPFQLLRLGPAIGIFCLISGCSGGSSSPLARLDDARALAADVRVQFGKANDASNRAVMADTDEASIAFAQDAQQSTHAVDTDVATLAPLLKSLSYEAEAQTLAQFVTRFGDYRKLDQTILGLAVENTNLKAQRLAFGPARDDADAFQTSLESILSDVAAKDLCRAKGLVHEAVLAVRQIQVIQAPHIAEADDGAMSRMETQMAHLESVAKDALGELSGLLAPTSAATLAAAQAALDHFAATTTELVKLSRRNSNVRSLDLAVREKPPLFAACDDSLRALSEALAKEGSKGTR